MQRVRQHQTGLTLISFIFLLTLTLSVTYVGIKLVPHYINYYSVRSAMAAVADESQNKAMSIREVQSSLSRKLNINYVNDIGPESVKVARGRNGNVLTVKYRIRESIVANVDACLTFEHTVQLGRVN